MRKIYFFKLAPSSLHLNRVCRPHGPGGSAQMANPTKAITATLRTMIAMAATSMAETRFAMPPSLWQSSSRFDLNHVVEAVRRGREEEWR
jgi:hypothetical protein